MRACAVWFACTAAARQPQRHVVLSRSRSASGVLTDASASEKKLSLDQEMHRVSRIKKHRHANLE